MRVLISWFACQISGIEGAITRSLSQWISLAVGKRSQHRTSFPVKIDRVILTGPSPITGYIDVPLVVVVADGRALDIGVVAPL